MNRWIFIFLMFFILIEGVTSIGVTPARTTVDFEPGLEKEVTLTILNSEAKDLNVIVFARGELNDSIAISESRFAISANEASRDITYKISLPTNLDPGLHKAEVVALQVPGGSEEAEAFVGAAVGVASQIYVQVPFPGKFLEAEMSVFGDQDEKQFIIGIVNRGNENIDVASANIKIFDTENIEIEEMQTNQVSVGAGERRELTAVWQVEAPLGQYNARAILSFDGEEMLVEKKFEIGDLLLDLKQIFVDNFRLGEIAEFNMIVENKWSEPIGNAYAEMRIFNEDFSELANIKSPSYDIPPGEQTTMVYYWDTKEVNSDLYDANVILYYGKSKTQQDLKLDVKSSSIDVIGLGYVISEADSGGSVSNSLIVVLVVVIVVLVLMNVLWFVVFRKKMHKKHK